MNLSCSSSIRTIPNNLPSTQRYQFQRIALVDSPKLKEYLEFNTLKIHFEDDDTGKKYELSIKVPINFNVLDVIKYSITIINKQLEQHNQLKFDKEVYNLYFAKKNGKPKSDLPALDYNLILFETGAVALFLKKKENKIKSSRCSIHSNNSTTILSNYINSNSL